MLYGQAAPKTEFLQNNIRIKIQFIPHRKHIMSPLLNQQFNVGKRAVYGENHMNLSDTLRGQNAAFDFAKTDGTY
jgi:hypothetical protein